MLQCFDLFQAINNLKANAAALNRANNTKPLPPKDLPKPQSEDYQEFHKKSEPSTALPEYRLSSSLPPDFFDNQEAKRQKNGKILFMDITSFYAPYVYVMGRVIFGWGTMSVWSYRLDTVNVGQLVNLQMTCEW